LSAVSGADTQTRLLLLLRCVSATSCWQCH